MSTINIDTLKFAERLEEAGATRAYAKTQIKALAAMYGSEAVSRKDLQIEFAPFRTELIMLKWMVCLSPALSSGMIALLAHIVFDLPR